MRTANPALSDRYFQQEAAEVGPRSSVMTVNGAVMKTGILAAVLIAAAGLSWSLIFPNGVGDGIIANKNLAIGFLLGGAIVGLILSLVICFAPKTAPIAAPVYAAAQGLFLGAISGLFAARYQGIVLEAVTLTIGVLVVMLLAYTTGLIRATEKFKLGVIAATGAIFLVYLVSMVLRLFGVGIPFIHDAGPIGIGFSVVVVIIAALNLVLDFDTIEMGARYGAPKYMEWFAAFGLMVTLVWLYLEILRLLAKIRSSN